jgi:hypothetical protein
VSTPKAVLDSGLLAADAGLMPRQAPAVPVLVAVAIALGVALIVPFTSVAKPRGMVGELAAGACASERAEIGRRAFAKRYGRRPMRACTKRMRGDARRAVRVAAEACQTELDDYGLEEFLLDWDDLADCVETYAEWELDGSLVDEQEDPVDVGEAEVQNRA